MEASIEKLASILHDSWRAEKIKIGWHIPNNCYSSTTPGRCKDCHPCVDAWENLTEDQKKAALMNAKLAHEYFESHQSLQIPIEELRPLDKMTDDEAITIAEYVLGYGEWLNAVVHRFGSDKIAIIDEFQNTVKHIDDYNKDRDNWNWVEIDKNFIIHHRTQNVLYSTQEAYMYLIEKGFIQITQKR